MLLITAFFASVLAFIYIKLARNVIRLRRESNISVGHGKSEPLEKAIRAHANFNEYVPLGLILMACLEINNFNTLIIILVGGLFLIGRFLHAQSFLKDKMDIDLRVKGMKCTFWSLIIMSGLNFFSIAMSFL
ncbi:MAG: MAPEG family protein [Betaproteobacteria bacterium]|jgi:uncharacterized membrane protein YecN with MAPEG domain|nr:MAPEG family protein [Betaproteobacteria bacterium]